MRSLNRKLARELLGSFGLLLAITSIIAVGMTCFVALRSAYHNLNEAKGRYYRQCRMADFWIDVKKMPLAELDSISRLPGVTEAQSRIQFYATVDMDDVDQPLNALIVSLPDRRQPLINDIVLQQGGYFSAQQENEVIVNDAFARHYRLLPGDRLRVLLNNRQQELLVVGTAISSEFTYLLGPGAVLPDPEHFSVLYMKQSYAEDVFDFDGAANQIVGQLSPSIRQDADELLQRAETLLEPYGVFSTTPLSQQISNQFLSNEIDGLGATAAIIPAAFLVAAALVLNVLVTRLARQQRTVIGTFKALGYTDWQLFRHFLVFGLAVGCAGGLLGSLLGYLSSAGMTAVYRLFFSFPDLRNQFYLATHATGMVVSVLCALAGSVNGARTVLKLQPAEAMRPEPPRAGGAIVLDSFPRLWQSLSAGWRMALRSVFRSRLRTLAAVFAAAMGSGLLVTGFMMIATQDFMIDFQFQRVVRGDIDLVFDEERGADALDELRRLPGVEWAEPLLNVPCTMQHGPYRRKIAITGLVANAQLTVPRDRQGEAIALPEIGLVLSRRLAQILHVAVGQKITVVPVKGDRRAMQLVVARISDTYIGLTAYADIKYLSRLLDEEFAVNGAQLKADPRPAQRRQLNRTLKEMPAVQSVTARLDMIRKLQETILANQLVFIGILVLFAGVLFFGSIVNSSFVSLAERQREVATFMALGYSSWQIGGIFFRENLLTNTVGTLLGFPAGYLLMELAALAYRENDLIRMPVVSAPWVWYTAMLLSMLFLLLAQGVVQLRISRTDFREALNVKE